MRWNSRSPNTNPRGWKAVENKNKQTSDVLETSEVFYNQLMNIKPASDSKFNTITRRIVKEMKRLHIPGTAIGIYFKGKEWTAGFGVTSLEHPLPITPDTLFQTGSISKTFTGTLLMLLVE